MSTLIISIVSLLIAMFTLGWNVFRDFSDRAKLKVSVMLGYRSTENSFFSWDIIKKNFPKISGKPKLLVSFTNIGKRPITVLGWTVKTLRQPSGEDHFLYQLINLPKRLQEGDFTQEQTDDIDFIQDNAQAIYAWDSTGKHWHLARKELGKLKHEIQRYKTESTQNRSGA